MRAGRACRRSGCGQPADAAPKGAWWTLFGDAELDSLLARVAVSNQSLRVAEARLRQARAP